MSKSKCPVDIPCPPKKIWTDEVYYSGKYIRKLRVNTGDVLTDILEKIGAIVGEGGFGVISVNGYDGIVQLDLNFEEGSLFINGSNSKINLDDRYSLIEKELKIELIEVEGVEDWYIEYTNEFLEGIEILNLSIDGIPLNERKYAHDHTTGTIDFQVIQGVEVGTEIEILYKIH